MHALTQAKATACVVLCALCPCQYSIGTSLIRVNFALGRAPGVFPGIIHNCCGNNPIRENEVEDTTAAVLMVDKYGGKDTPGNMAVNTSHIVCTGVSLPPYLSTISTAAVVSSTSFSRVKLRMKTSKKKIA